MPVVASGRWAVIGSSSAAGMGPSQRALGWVGRLQAEAGARGAQITNLAIGGTTTYHGLAVHTAPVPNRPSPHGSINIDAALALNPTLVLVAYPSNDSANGYTADETVRNLLAIRDAAAARGVPVLVQGMQPRNMSHGARALLPQIDRRLAAAIGGCFVEVGSAMAAPDGGINALYDAGDGVHLNDAGHAVLFARIKAVLDSGRCVRWAP
ncbi:MAG: SGNH/GDSL hydrolase family protein [Rubrivivax sp.]|nr:SGNH/GDSL hydrolase family protein [Rubrivivax sp.]